jgi:hypothetical protein
MGPPSRNKDFESIMREKTFGRSIAKYKKCCESGCLANVPDLGHWAQDN